MAQVMHDTLLSFQGQNVMGVYSRNKTKLEVFCNKNHIPFTKNEPNEIIKSQTIDAVYISTPHTDHYDWAKWALENNKHVLVEKPATIKNKQWLHLCELAKQQNTTRGNVDVFFSCPQTTSHHLQPR